MTHAVHRARSAVTVLTFCGRVVEGVQTGSWNQVTCKHCLRWRAPKTAQRTKTKSNGSFVSSRRAV
ncbi:hypothetical protein Rctr197k_103 [Virus Rctr197k]|nr:hypothetical protein Rctr197k_103 [Virus Rctr197k]